MTLNLLLGHHHPMMTCCEVNRRILMIPMPSLKGLNTIKYATAPLVKTYFGNQQARLLYLLFAVVIFVAAHNEIRATFCVQVFMESQQSERLTC